MEIKSAAEVTAFVTKDGSQIRELLAYRNSEIVRQSLAEARLRPGCSTAAHYHRQTEEIYYILEGVGTIRLGDESAHVQAGDAIAIPPLRVHKITNSGQTDLVFLCSCAPAYEHEDTVLVDAEET
jgi:mannose-6-phosphate isomerase-like protein (cupin superfamily)